MIFGTAGHIDHGKSSLVRALTGIDPDRLKEEKARGITIELGFAYRDAMGFVDVPGHERLVHTMLAGAHGIDCVLLVVAADDGPMPQTREHLAIVELLGIADLLVALTKADAVDAARLAAAAAEVAAMLVPTRYADAAIHPVSALTGTGIAALERDLAARRPPARPTDRRFRLAVDRGFSIVGAGTVVTGTVLSGAVGIGDEVLISPAGTPARIRGIQHGNRPVARADTGERCALNLAGIARDAVARGDVVLDPALHAPTRRLDMTLTLPPGEKPPRAWLPVRAHHGAAELGARLIPLADGFAQLVLDTPLAAAAGDRIVLRDTSAQRTLGGGTILDLRAPERRRRTQERRSVLAALNAPAARAMVDALLAAPPWHLDAEAFLRDHALADDALFARDGIVRLEAYAIAASTWARLRRAIGAALDAEHAAHPDRQGIAGEKLRLALDPRLPPAVFAALAAALGRAGELVPGPFLRRPGHTARLAPDDEALWRRIAPALAGAERFRPPRVRDLATALAAPEARVRKVLKGVTRRGEIEEVADDHYFLRATVAEMSAVAATLPAPFTAAAFRDTLGQRAGNPGRKVAIQILEFLDRHGVTIRRGDERVVDRRRIGLFAADPVSAGPPDGRATSPVGRPDFKSGRGRQTVPGGFDSHSLPPASTPAGPVAPRR